MTWYVRAMRVGLLSGLLLLSVIVSSTQFVQAAHADPRNPDDVIEEIRRAAEERGAGSVLALSSGFRVALDARLSRENIRKKVEPPERAIDGVVRTVIGIVLLIAWLFIGPYVALGSGLGSLFSGRGDRAISAALLTYLLPFMAIIGYMMSEPEEFIERDLIFLVHSDAGELVDLETGVDLLSVSADFDTREAWQSDGRRRDDVLDVELELEIRNRSSVGLVYGEAVCFWKDDGGTVRLVTHSPFFPDDPKGGGGRFSFLLPGVVGKGIGRFEIDGMLKLFDSLLDARRQPDCRLVNLRGKRHLLDGESEGIGVTWGGRRLMVENRGDRYLRRVWVGCFVERFPQEGQEDMRQEKLEYQTVVLEFDSRLLAPAETREKLIDYGELVYCEPKSVEEIPREEMKACTACE